MKWGIMATGNIAKKFASTVIRMKQEGETLAAVGSRSAETAAAFAKEYHVEKHYGSYEQLACDPAVEAVYVATPNSMHYENCKTCLLHGKNVLCEKPFTINAKQAEELYDLAEKKKLFIMEAFWIWFLPLHEKLRELLKEGAIGEIRRIECQYGFVAEGARRERKFKSELGGGALLDIGIYNLGFLHMIKNVPPDRFMSEVHMNEYGTDDYSKLTLLYPDGATAESVQAIGEVLERNALICGTGGTIFLKDFQNAQSMTVSIQNREEMVMEYPCDINGFEYEIREASQCIREGKSFSSRYTPKDSLAINKLLYDIRMSWNMRFDGEREF